MIKSRTLDAVPLAEQIAEIARCIRSFPYFCCRYCKVLDTQSGEWLPFELWDAQIPIAEALQIKPKVIVLKARQLGLSWLCVARMLHKALFWPLSFGLMYSYRDDEAVELLTRLTRTDPPYGMYQQLPDWMRLGVNSNVHTAKFGNGSIVKALPTTAGDSYTASIVLIDEADIVPNLNSILRRVKPTVDNGGQLFLVSRADKSTGDGREGKGLNSTFKRIYIGATTGENTYTPFFLPWSAHPRRTVEWYNEQSRDIQSRTGSLDDLYEQYPATETEALAARTQNQRINPEWCERNYAPMPELVDGLPPEVPGLRVWECPIPGRRYVIGADVAEGKETSDDSAAVVFDQDGNEVAEIAGRIEIAVYAEYLHHLAKWYNRAGVLVERNNHGHAIILRLKELGTKLENGRDKAPGYMSDTRGKAEMYSALAEALRDDVTKVRSKAALLQIMSIERATLRAPSGMLDDIADAYAIGVTALNSVNVRPASFGVF